MEADGPTTLDLVGGGRLVVPPGTIAAGTRIVARTADTPRAGHAELTMVGRAVGFDELASGAISGRLTLELP